jgi:hypothetical protein
MDPRVMTPAAGLRAQFDLSMDVYRRIVAINEALRVLHASTNPAFAQRLKELEGEAEESAPVAPGAGKQPETLTRVAGSLRSLLSLLQSTDAAPTTQAAEAVRGRIAAADAVLGRWKALQGEMNSR